MEAISGNPLEVSARTFATVALKLSMDYVRSAQTLDAALAKGEEFGELLARSEWKDLKFGGASPGKKVYTAIIPDALADAFLPLFQHFGIQVCGPTTHTLISTLDSPEEPGAPGGSKEPGAPDSPKEPGTPDSPKPKKTKGKK